MLHYLYPVHYGWENIDFVCMLLGLYIYMVQICTDMYTRINDTILAEDRTMRKLLKIDESRRKFGKLKKTFF